MFKQPPHPLYSPISALNHVQYTLHRLVWTVFKGEIPQGKVVHRSRGAEGGTLLDHLSLVKKSEVIRTADTTALVNMLLQEVLGLDELNNTPRERWEVPFQGLLRFQGPSLTCLTVSNYGRAKMKGEFVEMSFKNGYIVAHFGDPYIGVHRLVASTFVTNDDHNSRTFVNHMNEIKHDNRAINLEWTTPQENTAFSVGRPVDIVDVSKDSDNVW